MRRLASCQGPVFARKRVFMRHMLILSAGVFFFCGAVAYGFVDDWERLGTFVTNYHHEPTPKRVPEMLHGVLKGRLAAEFTAKEPPHKLVLLAHAFGHMARGNAALVRGFEAQFAASTRPGQLFLLTVLPVCGDQETVKQIRAWQQDPKFDDLKTPLEITHSLLSDPKRRLPRDRPARLPTDLDLLWADFLVTGEYAPVSRILDVFDQQGLLRTQIETCMKKNADNRDDLLTVLQVLGLLRPGTVDKLVEGDLALTILHDGRGKIRADPAVAVWALQPFLNLTAEDWKGNLLLKATASWSMQSNLEQHPRLRELLTKHCDQRANKSRQLVHRWLAKSGDRKNDP
jgi:hypothetical protein